MISKRRSQAPDIVVKCREMNHSSVVGPPRALQVRIDIRGERHQGALDRLERFSVQDPHVNVGGGELAIDRAAGQGDRDYGDISR